MVASFATKALLSLAAWTQILNGPSPPQDVFSPEDLQNGHFAARKDHLKEQLGSLLDFETNIRNGNGRAISNGTVCVVSLQTGDTPEGIAAPYFRGTIDPSLLRLPGTAQDWRDAIAFHETGHCQPEQQGHGDQVTEYQAQAFAGVMAEKAHRAGAADSMDVATANRALYAIDEMMSGWDHRHALVAIAPLAGERPALRGGLDQAADRAVEDIRRAKDDVYVEIGRADLNPFDRIEALVAIRDNPALGLTAPQKETLLAINNDGTAQEAEAFLEKTRIPSAARADFERALRTSLISRGEQRGAAHPELVYASARDVLERGVRGNPAGYRFLEIFAAGAASVAPGYFGLPDPGVYRAPPARASHEAFAEGVPLPVTRPDPPKP